MRSLMGKLNKFALAPGSLSDIGASASTVSSSSDMSSLVEKAAPKRSHKAAPKMVEATESTDSAPSADASASDASAADNGTTSDEPSATE
jgi:hypothetical protein